MSLNETRKSRRLDRKERELVRIQKSGRLLFHGSNIASSTRRSLNQQGNTTDEAAKKAMRSIKYVSGMALSGAMVDSIRSKKTLSKSYRYKTVVEREEDKMVDASMENLKKGKASKPIDLTSFAE